LRAQPKRIICQPVTAPRFIKPCSPTTASKPPTGERCTHEVKWDGYRFQVLKVGRVVRLFSRNGADWTERMPAMAGAFASLPARVAQIDGELCLCDADGRPDFRALMRAARQRPADETRLSFHAFDLLHLNAADLKPKPLAERRRRLVDLVHGLDEAVPVLYLPDAFGSGDELLAMCAKMRLEGIVSKRLDRPYVSGPTRDWIKVKCAAWKEANRWRAEVFEKTR
jgi:bifunctional non-homologous end joining protein LigD